MQKSTVNETRHELIVFITVKVEQKYQTSKRKEGPSKNKRIMVYADNG